MSDDDDDSRMESLLGRGNAAAGGAINNNDNYNRGTVAATPAAQNRRRRSVGPESSPASSSSSPAIPPTPAVPHTPGAIPPTPSTGNSSSSHPSGSGMNNNNSNNSSSSPATPLTPLSLDGQGEQRAGQRSDRNSNGGHEASSPAAASDGSSSPQQQQQQQQPPPPDDEPLFGQGGGNGDETAYIRGTNVHVPTAAAAFTDFLRTFVSLRHSQRRENRNNGNSNNNNNNSDSDDDSLDSQLDDEASSRPLYLSRLQSLLTHGILPQQQHGGRRRGQNHAASASSSSGIGDAAATASLDIDTMHLYYHSRDCQLFYNHLVAFPMEIVPLMDIIVQRELERLMTAIQQQERQNDGATMNTLLLSSSIPRVQVRPYNLRQVSNLRSLDPVSMDSLLSIKGMIVRASPIIPDLKVAHFACCICGHVLLVTLDRGRIAEPRQACPTCNTKSSSFQLLHCRSLYADKQMVRLQETPDEVPAGQTPASVVTFCFDDLVDAFSPGDKVEVTGVLRAQPVRVHPKLSKVKAIYKTYIDVIHFRVITGMETRDNNHSDNNNNGDSTATKTKQSLQSQQQWSEERVAELKTLSQQPDIYDKLTMSLAPSIWELDDVKKGILAMLFGGNHVRVKRGRNSSAAAARRRRQQRRDNDNDNDRNNNDDSSRNSWLDQEDDDDEDIGDIGGGAASSSTVKLQKRGDINILLCGDPGTSKSQLLSYVNKLSTRGVYTSGKGSSAVGLTASVVRDPETRDLVLESGALVLSDLGICCIDEL
jgi:MCM P-loop domain/MCM OB domain